MIVIRLLKIISQASDEAIRNKRAIVRVDFNVSIFNGNVGEDYRIRMTLPTIEFLSKRGCKVILMSHLGRPNGKNLKFSLEPVSKRLSDIIGNRAKVSFVYDCIGPVVHDAINSMDNGDILLLENLRYYKQEENNDPEFSKELASLADFYVNDAFSTSHRKHASTFGAANLFDIRLAGFNLNKEVEYLSMIKDKPIKPLILLVGGVKIKDKIGALENLLPKADKVLIGGAASFTFLKAKGIEIGNSLIDHEYLSWVTKALSLYGDKIVLPTDHIVASNPDVDSAHLVKGNIPENMAGFDIGHETVNHFSDIVGNNGSGTIFWNGPMGLFEKNIFANGTVNVARSMALAYWRGSKTLIGGGDTLEAMKKAGVHENEVSHVSTGGGATLKFLAGDDMPGLRILETTTE